MSTESQPNDPPLATCSTCGRKTWSMGQVGTECNMPQPDKSRCQGEMQRREQQEWTPEYLHSIGIFTTEQVCAAHNAALAAERKFRDEADLSELAALREQLDAERDKVKKWEDESDRRDIDEADYRQKMVAEIQARDKQLAAERQRREQAETNVSELGRELKLTTTQLATERQQLLFAQAAIEKKDEVIKKCIKSLGVLFALPPAGNPEQWERTKTVLESVISLKSDLSLLHQHDEEVRKPLVEALRASRRKVETLSYSDFKMSWLDEIDDALAKEGK